MKLFILITLCIVPVWPHILPHSDPATRIIGGQSASAGQYPWIAAIYKNTASERIFCAGSIFNEQWILTAAQCVYEATSFSIQVGSNQLQGNDQNRLTLDAQISFHEPRFDPETLRHDIGLIKLNSPLTFNDYIKPVLILGSAAPVYDGRAVEVAGWGQSSDTGDLVNDLQYVNMVILGQNACKTYYGDFLWGSMCCTVSNYNQGPCLGDTGTPLMTAARLGNGTMQIAVATFISSNGCESTDPKGYTTVPPYYNWILQTIEDN